MILYPYGNKNPHYLSNDLMVIIFQQFLLEVRFDSHRIFTCSGKTIFIYSLQPSTESTTQCITP